MLAGFIEAKDDGSGGDNWSYNSCKAPVECCHQQTNTSFQTDLFADALQYTGCRQSWSRCLWNQQVIAAGGRVSTAQK